jgi:hypothetical protein
MTPPTEDEIREMERLNMVCMEDAERKKFYDAARSFVPRACAALRKLRLEHGAACRDIIKTDKENAALRARIQELQSGAQGPYRVACDNHNEHGPIFTDGRPLLDDRCPWCVIAALEKQCYDLQGAMDADAERLRDAERLVWGDEKTWGCDAPEHLAEEILALRKQRDDLQAANTAEVERRRKAEEVRG